MVLTARRLLVLTVLTASGAVASATAASVYAAGEPLRRGAARALSDAALYAVVADSTQPATRRLAHLQQLSAGACFSVREMLFGESPERKAAVMRARALLPHASAEAPQLIAAGDALVREAPHLSTADRALRVFLPAALERRVDHCRATF